MEYIYSYIIITIIFILSLLIIYGKIKKDIISNKIIDKCIKKLLGKIEEKQKESIDQIIIIKESAISNAITNNFKDEIFEFIKEIVDKYNKENYNMRMLA